MRLPARLIDGADRVFDRPEAYSPRLRPREIRYQGLIFTAVGQGADGVWEYRSPDRLTASRAQATVITADEREHVITIPVGRPPKTWPYGGRIARLWTTRDQQGRVVYRVIEAHG